jgi:ATP-dependent Clp protease ATP-binding subunit ClpC
LNRIDEVIVFHELAQPEVEQIVDLLFKRIQKQLETKGIGIELTESVRAHLASVGYDRELGARPLRRTLQRLIEDPLSERLLNREFHAGEMVVVDLDGDEIVFRVIEGVDPTAMELAESSSAE